MVNPLRAFWFFIAATALLAACEVPGAALPADNGSQNAGGEGSLEQLSAFFAAQPQNTPETPCEYAFTGALADLASEGDSLGALLEALHGRYASIDLSGASGAEIAAGPGVNSPRAKAKYLVSLSLPASLTKIGRRAFARCTELSSVILNGSPPALTGTDVFADTSPYLFFHAGYNQSGLAYPKDSGWKRYGGRIKLKFSAGGVEFNMTYVPAVLNFPRGINDDVTASVAQPYLIAETETTWELWAAARTWALENGYSIRDGITAAGLPDDPVRNSWYNFAVWCNAMTEWFSAETGAELSPAYYGNYTNGFSVLAKNSDPGFNQQETEMPYKALPGKTGFRLPTADEWELAARWRNDDTNTVPGYSNPWFTKGNSASGASASYENEAETLRYAVRGPNPLPVKSRRPNALGLYDMSGNVWEWVDSWFYVAFNSQNCNIQVHEMGGAWNYGDMPYMQLGKISYYEADGGPGYVGFRLVLPVN